MPVLMETLPIALDLPALIIDVTVEVLMSIACIVLTDLSVELGYVVTGTLDDAAPLLTLNKMEFTDESMSETVRLVTDEPLLLCGEAEDAELTVL